MFFAGSHVRRFVGHRREVFHYLNRRTTRYVYRGNCAAIALLYPIHWPLPGRYRSGQYPVVTPWRAIVLPSHVQPLLQRRSHPPRSASRISPDAESHGRRLSLPVLVHFHALLFVSSLPSFTPWLRFYKNISVFYQNYFL